MNERALLHFRLNGREVEIEAPPMRRLLDLIREDLALTGAKEGCGEGECGACSIVMNGALVNSCIIPAIQADGAEIVTVEAMAETAVGAAVQRAFVEHGGSQCGICTPGMIVASCWLATHRDARPGTPAASLRDLLAGNLCRCTGYDLILASVEAALADADGGSGGS